MTSRKGLSLFAARYLIDCKWPIEGTGQGLIVCGDPVDVGRRKSCPYCPEHAEKAYPVYAYLQKMSISAVHTHGGTARTKVEPEDGDPQEVEL